MGLVGLPISIFLYWLILHYKKDNPFPKGGIARLAVAGAVSVVFSVILTIPINAAISFFRLGVVSDPAGWVQALQNGPEAITEHIQNANAGVKPSFLWNLIGMFFGAGLLEEGFKYLTCRAAIRKEGMVRTWMDSVIAFAFVGITFELLENIVFGMGTDLVAAIFRALAPAHFIFGVIMGYFFGKYRVTGQKKYRVMAFWIPVIYHTITNALIGSMDLSKFYHDIGIPTAISHIVVAVITVFIIFRWQKNRTLDVPVLE